MDVLSKIDRGELILRIKQMGVNSVINELAEIGELLRLAKAGQAAQWVSVEERLPPEGQHVLADFPGLPFITAWYQFVCGDMTLWHDYRNVQICKGEPTRWMELPERSERGAG